MLLTLRSAVCAFIFAGSLMYFVGLLMLRYFEVTFNYPKECIIMIRSISQTVMQMDFSNTFCMFDPISMYQYILIWI